MEQTRKGDLHDRVSSGSCQAGGIDRVVSCWCGKVAIDAQEQLRQLDAGITRRARAVPHKDG